MREIREKLRNRRRLASVILTTLLVIVFFVGILSAQDHRRVLAWEQTTTNQALTFINNVGTVNTITVDIYESDGTFWGTEYVVLQGHQTIAFEPGDSDSNGWDLPVVNTSVGGHSTPWEDAAYGITATSEKSFSLLGYTDEQRHAGSGYSAIWTHDAVTESVWGMWNYDGDEDKADYFFIYNPGTATANVSIDLYESDGTPISSNVVVVGPKETTTVYPKYDLNSQPDDNNNIGVFMESDQEIHVSVYTQLGQDYNGGEPNEWHTHDVVSGVFVPFISECNSDEYIWTDAKTSGQQQSAARVTNPNDYAITVTEEWYEYVDSANHYNQNVYTTNTIIPAYGTAELPRPAGIYNASGNDPRTHWRRLTGTGSFHAHVSYFEQIDLPSTPRYSWRWGNFKPGNTDDVFLVNPTDENITVHVERWKNGNTTAIPGSYDIVLTPRASIMASLPSEGAVPWDYGESPISQDSAENQTWHFYSDMPFVLHIQDWDYGDLLPLDCGAGDYELDFGDNPDMPYPTLLENDGARHLLIPDGVFLGYAVDAEADGQPTTEADGDDLNNDDEDGIVFTTELYPGSNACFDVTASGDGFLSTWIDFNADGDWSDAGERIFSGYGLLDGVTNLCFPVPEDAAEACTYMRFRYISDSATPADCEYCEPDNDPSVLTMLYTGEDCSFTQHSQDLDKVDCSGDPEFLDMVYIISSNKSNPYDGTAKIWFEDYVVLDEYFNIDAGEAGESKLPSNTYVHIFDEEDGEQIQYIQFHTSCSQPLNYGDQFGSARLEGFINEDGEIIDCGEVAPEIDFDGYWSNGEVEDYKVCIARDWDYGDAPDSYSTTNSSNGARHEIIPGGIYLGYGVDEDADGYPSVDADGDDLTNTDDEDGIVFLTELNPGELACFDVVAEGNGYLNAWIDFNNNGNWNESVEHIIDNQGLISGTTNLCFEVPETAVEACTYMRFRYNTGVPCDFCEPDNKPAILTFQYTGEDCSATSHSQSADKVSCDGDPEFTDPVFIKATNNENPAALFPKTWFIGDVSLDGYFDLNAANAGNTKLENNTYIHIFEYNGGDLLQTVEFHTSCSQPLMEGNQFGASLLVNFVAEGGEEIDCSDAQPEIPYDGPIDNGEVEDYRVCIQNHWDFGDLPDSYSTTYSQDGARHELIPGGVYLGSAVDEDTDGHPSVDADGDDLSDLDDEDGITFTTELIPGEMACFDVTAVGDGYLNVWIDFNNDGDLADAGEKVFNNHGLDTGVTHLCFPIPEDAVEACTYMRFRYHAIPQGVCDLCEPDNKPAILTMLYNGEDCSNTSHSQAPDKVECFDDAGYTDPVWIRASDKANPNDGAAKVWHEDWVDLNGYFEIDAANGGEPRLKAETHVHIYDAPGGTLLQQIEFHTSCSQPLFIGNQFGSLVLDTFIEESGEEINCAEDIPVLDYFGPADNGEVEDYRVCIANHWDYGDLPDSYKTTNGNNGARHELIPGGVYLGSAVDEDADGYPTTGADGDDLTDADDEDSVIFTTALVPGQTACFDVTAVGDGYLNVWIDFAADGGFDEAGDHIFENYALETGTENLCFPIPEDAVEACTYMRFRYHAPELGICDLCEPDNKPAILTMLYNGEDCSNLFHSQDPSKVECFDDAGYTDPVWIRASDKANPNDGAAKVWHEDWVDLDSFFDIDASNGGETKLKAETHVHIYDAPGGTLLQQIEFHTSCSQPLFVGNQFGSLVLDTFIAESGGEINCEEDLVPIDYYGPVDNGEVEDYRVCLERLYDYGDDPDTPYPTYDSNNGAKHQLIPGGVYLGYSVDADDDGQPTVDADGDDTDGNDDEDGIIFTTQLVPGQPACIDVIASGDGYLNAWIDFNADGDWTDAFEHIFDDYELEDGTSNICFEVPEDAEPACTYTRFRYSSLPGHPPCDYCEAGQDPSQLTIKYTGEDCSATDHSQDPAKVSCSGDPVFVSPVYVFSNNKNTPYAGGTEKIWFEGWVDLNDTFIIDSAYEGHSKLSNDTYVYFLDGPEGNILQSVKFHTSCSEPLYENDQFGAAELKSFVAEGGAVIECGEILPDCDYCEPDNKPAVLGMQYTGEDCSSTIHQQDPSKVFCDGDPEFANTVWIRASDKENPTDGSAKVWYEGWVDLDSIFEIDAANAGLSKLNNETHVHIFDGPGGNLLQQVEFHTSCSQPINPENQFGSLYLHHFIAEDDEPTECDDYESGYGQMSWDGPWPDGEVEDYPICIGHLYDFGDAPEPYPTLLEDDGARHQIVEGIYLGAQVDNEPDGQLGGMPPGLAYGDDNQDGNDDEDGIAFPDSFVAWEENCIEVTASVEGYLNGWIDFNEDGDWSDPEDHIFNDLLIPAGTSTQCFFLAIDYIPGETSWDTFMRVRFNIDDPEGMLSFTGPWDNGEIEDYYIGGFLGLDNLTEIPEKYDLSAPYPNPFNPATTLDYAVPERGHVTINIYNGLGQLVDTPVNEHHDPGYYSLRWNGNAFPSGVYFVQLITDDKNIKHKMVLLK